MISETALQERLAAAAAASGPDRFRALAAEKARIAAEAWDIHPGRNLYGQLTVAVRGGRHATIGHVELTATGGVTAVNVWTGPPDGPPQYRIVNPPLLVPDPSGPITLPGPGGRPRRYRVDPVTAIAEAITGGHR